MFKLISLIHESILLDLNLKSTAVKSWWHRITVVPILWSIAGDKRIWPTATAANIRSVYVLRWGFAFIVGAIVTILSLMIHWSAPTVAVWWRLFVHIPWIISSHRLHTTERFDWRWWSITGSAPGTWWRWRCISVWVSIVWIWVTVTVQITGFTGWHRTSGKFEYALLRCILMYHIRNSYLESRSSTRLRP